MMQFGSLADIKLLTEALKDKACCLPLSECEFQVSMSPSTLEHYVRVTCSNCSNKIVFKVKTFMGCVELTFDSASNKLGHAFQFGDLLGGGSLKEVLEEASADYAKRPAWQRGVVEDPKRSLRGLCSHPYIESNQCIRCGKVILENRTSEPEHKPIRKIRF